jgi:Zn-dependent M28 family amino/carboxypeptidase
MPTLPDRGAANPSPELPSTADNGKLARQYLQAMVGEIGRREPGTKEEKLTAQYIQDVFKELGYTPTVQKFSFHDQEEGKDFNSSNVIAVKNGLSDKVIVVGAHYDSTYEDGSKGADDNASGVAVMLEVAKLVKALETPYTIQFIAFGAEEFNLSGSTYFVDNLATTERKNIVGMFNLDSLIASDKTYIYGNDGPGTMRDWVLNDAARRKMALESKTAQDMNNADGSPCECADYDAFERAGIPYAYFEATNWDLSADGMTQVDVKYGDQGKIRHTKYDTLAYIDATFPKRIDHHLNLFVTLLFDLLTQY